MKYYSFFTQYIGVYFDDVDDGIDTLFDPSFKILQSFSIAEKESCPNPGVSPDGTRTGSCCFIGDVLQFTCNEDFELVGADTIECLSEGNWSSPRPLCRRKDNNVDYILFFPPFL